VTSPRSKPTPPSESVAVGPSATGANPLVVTPPQATVLRDLLGMAEEMDKTLDAIYNLDPGAHATRSRDYGRGFAEALRVIRAEIDTRMGLWAARVHIASVVPAASDGIHTHG
jgi:hypothetical protein